VGVEQLVAAGPERDPLDAGDERLEVIAAAPGGRTLGERGDLVRPRGLVQPDLDLDAVVEVSGGRADR
jgi:hypothetical protein